MFRSGFFGQALFLTFVLILPQVSWSACAPGAKAPVYPLAIREERPHDPSAYTQGLIFHDGHLFESTGRYGESTIRRVSLENGVVLRQTALPSHLFGEGLAPGARGLWQLTWKNGLALLWDPVTLRLKDRAKYSGEGWGLARSDSVLFMSDGSHRIRRLDPESLEERGGIEVCDDGEPVYRLNELEMVRGLLWANVWKQDRIAAIRPSTGEVHFWLDAAALRRRQPATAEALNGIAFDEARGHVWLTGKWWDRMYRVEVLVSGNELRMGWTRINTDEKRCWVRSPAMAVGR